MDQVSQVQATAQSLDSLQQEYQHLTEQVAECERQAAVNSELRLIAHGLQELQEEQVQLRPLAEQAQDLRRENQELQQHAAALPNAKVMLSTRLTYGEPFSA